MKSSFCIDLQRFMLIPTKFPLTRFAACQSKKCTKEFILFTSLKYEKVRLRLMRNLTFYFFICLISKVYFAANTNSPVMSLKNTLYLPAGTMMLSPPFVPVP